MFSTPRPQYLSTPNPDSDSLCQVMASNNVKEAARIQDMAIEPLPPTVQREGKLIPFFEQGLITGGLLFIAPVVGALATAGFKG